MCSLFLNSSKPAKEKRDGIRVEGLTRIFHGISTAGVQSGMSTALRLFGLLDILNNMPSLPSLRAPYIHALLRALATKPHEISGFSCTGCTSASSLLRTFAVLLISGFPHGEPYNSHHCQNMKTGFTVFASIFQTYEDKILLQMR